MRGGVGPEGVPPSEGVADSESPGIFDKITGVFSTDTLNEGTNMIEDKLGEGTDMIKGKLGEGTEEAGNFFGSLFGEKPPVAQAQGAQTQGAQTQGAQTQVAQTQGAQTQGAQTQVNQAQGAQIQAPVTEALGGRRSSKSRSMRMKGGLNPAFGYYAAPVTDSVTAQPTYMMKSTGGKRRKRTCKRRKSCRRKRSCKRRRSKRH
jgi:hypothetical protein